MNEALKIPLGKKIRLPVPIILKAYENYAAFCQGNHVNLALADTALYRLFRRKLVDYLPPFSHPIPPGESDLFQSRVAAKLEAIAQGDFSSLTLSISGLEIPVLENCIRFTLSPFIYQHCLDIPYTHGETDRDHLTYVRFLVKPNDGENSWWVQNAPIPQTNTKSCSICFGNPEEAGHHKSLPLKYSVIAVLFRNEHSHRLESGRVIPEEKLQAVLFQFEAKFRTQEFHSIRFLENHTMNLSLKAEGITYKPYKNPVEPEWEGKKAQPSIAKGFQLFWKGNPQTLCVVPCSKNRGDQSGFLVSKNAPFTLAKEIHSFKVYLDQESQVESLLLALFYCKNESQGDLGNV
jgi:hypothetical protein